VLVPQALPITLRIPANLLEAGQTYRVRTQANDPSGTNSRLTVPFHR